MNLNNISCDSHEIGNHIEEENESPNIGLKKTNSLKTSKKYDH